MKGQQPSGRSVDGGAVALAVSAAPSTAAALERALADDLEWGVSPGWSAEELARAADDHGVSSLLWSRLESAGGRAAALRALLHPVALAAAARDLLVQRELTAVSTSLAAAGVNALLIKGAALAFTAYSQPWLRPRVDTDLLVEASTVADATHALEAAGYRRSDAVSTGTLVSHQHAFERTDPGGLRHVLDLHWKIVNPQVFDGVLPFRQLWHRSVGAPQLGAFSRVPCAVDAIVLACIHRLAHHQRHDRLIWLYDLRLLSHALSPGEWTELCERAAAHRVAGICLDGLRQARSRLGGRLPGSVAAILEESSRAEPSRAYLEGTMRKRDVLVSDLSHLRSWRARLRLLREHAFPPPAFVMTRYRTRHRLLLPALYAHRLVMGAWRWMRA